MNYNFDEIINRRGTGCVKWDEEVSIPASNSSPAGDKGANEIIPLWVADMDFKAAPAIQEAIRKRVAHGVFGYTVVQAPYYDSVISWFSRRHHWTIERNWIQYITGVVPALSVIVKAFTQPGDKVVLQTPVYNCFFSSVRNNGCEIVENALIAREHEGMHYFEMDYDDLQQKVADPRVKLLILCNPHNPVGRVWSREELARVYNICIENGVIVVSDEIHNELTFPNLLYTPYGTIDEGLKNAVICTSASKSFNIAGLQMANIICAHADWREKIDRAININEVCDVNPFGPVATQAAYNESEDWLNELRSYLYQNYQALCRFFTTELPQLKLTHMEGTYLVWVDIRSTGLSSDALTQLLLQEGKVQVNSGTMYGAETGEGFIRINIACPRSLLMEGLRRIKQVLNH